MNNQTRFVSILLLLFAVMPVAARAEEGTATVTSRSVNIVPKEEANRLWQTARKYALVIGISDYQDDRYDLTAASNDANNVANLLKDETLAGYTEVIKLVDAQAEKSLILRNLETIAKKAGPNDTVLIFYAGHGFTSGKKAYFLPYNGDQEYPESSSIDMKVIIDILKDMDAKQKLLVLDCCHSGSAEALLSLTRGKGEASIKDETMKQLSAGEGIVILASCRENEVSYEQNGSGYFTKYFIEGLKGAADTDQSSGGNNDGFVSVTEAGTYVSYKANEEVMRNFNKTQRARIIGSMEGMIQITHPLVASLAVDTSKETASKKPSSASFINQIGMEMITIPAGKFLRGSDQGAEDERPAKTICLDAYCISKYEVTLGEYKKFLKETGYRALPDWVLKYSPSDECPVVGVSWQDAVSFCKWLSKKTGKTYRLPTEAEWEKACRGTDGREYPWGNEMPDAGGIYRANYDPGKYIEDGYEYTAKAGNFQDGVSAYGCWDMAGNVWEWCEDWYAEAYYQESPDNNPRGPASGVKRVVRGGSWSSKALNLRAANRHSFAPESQLNYVGFRCCAQ